jgi:hypothetical protein
MTIENPQILIKYLFGPKKQTIICYAASSSSKFPKIWSKDFHTNSNFIKAKFCLLASCIKLIAREFHARKNVLVLPQIINITDYIGVMRILLRMYMWIGSIYYHSNYTRSFPDTKFNNKILSFLIFLQPLDTLLSSPQIPLDLLEFQWEQKRLFGLR